MTPPNESDTLKTQQYGDGRNLSARASLHARYSTNPHGWMQWMFDQLLEANLPPNAQIVEFGCGPGWLWQRNATRVPAGWSVTLTDFSPGMIEEARRNTADKGLHLDFKVVDIQSPPFETAQFEAVIANHMLYHVPNRPQALAEVERILKHGGYFFAATNGMNHMPELNTLMQHFVSDLDVQHEFHVDGFNLENGAEQLAAYFPDVTLLRYEDSLEVTEVEPIIDYLLSSTVLRRHLDEQRVNQLRQIIAQAIQQSGAFHIHKDAGLFIARKV